MRQLPRALGGDRVKAQLLLIAAALFSLFGCSQIPTATDWSNNQIGRPAETLYVGASKPESYVSRNGLEITKYQDTSGNWVHVLPIRPDCESHFEADNNGIIIRYRLEGSRCF